MVIDSADAALQDELIRAFSSELIRFYYGGDLTGNLTNYLTDNLTDHAEVPVYTTEKSLRP